MFNWRKKKAAKSRVLGLDLHEDGCALAVLDLKDPTNPAVLTAHWCALDGAREQQFRQALRAVGGEGLPVVANINHNAYSLVQLEAPDLPDEEMREAMRWRVKDLIDFPVEDAVLDVFRLPKSRRPGAPDLVYVVVARADELQQLVQLLTGAGLDIVAIDIVEMAMRNLALYLDQPQRPRAYLHLRPRDTVIEIADGPDVYLSRRIIQDLDLDADPALLSAQMENLALEVQRSLDYFESQYALGPADQLSVIVSREALFNAFSEIANTFLTVASVRFDFSALTFADGVDAEELDLGMTAIGAAMRRAA